MQVRNRLRRLATNLGGLRPNPERITLIWVVVPVDVDEASAAADIEDVEVITTTLSPIDRVSFVDCEGASALYFEERESVLQDEPQPTWA